MNTVYILGAGFSYPLGGPLLKQLFGDNATKFAMDRYKHFKDDFDCLAEWVPEIYRMFRADEDKSDQTVLWQNAEDFLECLELIQKDLKSPRLPPIINELTNRIAGAITKAHNEFPVNSPNQEQVFSRLPREFRNSKLAIADAPLPTDAAFKPHVAKNVEAEKANWIRHFLAAAKRLLAAQCSAFFDSHDVGSDKWAPYREWMKRISERETSDTILTFNYDTVLESTIRKLEIKNIPVVLPAVASEHAAGHAILKLHGSVDWRKVGSTEIARPTAEDLAKADYVPFAVKLKDGQFVLGTPGPEKTDPDNALRPLWNLAKRRIEECQRIVLIGYSMPGTDAYSRRFLRDAIASAKTKQLRIHIVLGAPGVSDGPAQRLKELLAAMTGRADLIEIEKLGAEDYLDVEKGIFELANRVRPHER